MAPFLGRLHYGSVSFQENRGCSAKRPCKRSRAVGTRLRFNCAQISGTRLTEARLGKILLQSQLETRGYSIDFRIEKR